MSSNRTFTFNPANHANPMDPMDSERDYVAIDMPPAQSQFGTHLQHKKQLSPKESVDIMTRSMGNAVKILVTGADYHAEQPTANPHIAESSGSGFAIAIDGLHKMLVTNAHVIQNAIDVRVKIGSESQLYKTDVSWVDHNSDLAFLVMPPELEHKLVPAVLNTKVLAIGSKVYVVGFPQLGDEICFTEGVIARIEVSDYSHSDEQLLQYQVTAAINPGNSGGPVYDQRGQLVGIAFQGAGNSQGFIIPIDVLLHSYRDFQRQQYGGFPSLFLGTQALTKHLKKTLKIAEGQSGVRVGRIHPLSAAARILKENDVITHVCPSAAALQNQDGMLDDSSLAISNEGMVRYFGVMLDWEYMIKRINVPGIAVLNIIRQGKAMRVQIPLQHDTDRCLIAPWQYGQPQYLVYYGLVLKIIEGNDCMPGLSDSHKKKADAQLCMIHSVFQSEGTLGLEEMGREVIESINDQPIGNMAELFKQLANRQAKQMILRLRSKKIVVVPNILHPEHAEELVEHQNILNKYFVDRVCAEALKPLLRKFGLEVLATHGTSMANIQDGHFSQQQQLPDRYSEKKQALPEQDLFSGGLAAMEVLQDDIPDQANPEHQEKKQRLAAHNRVKDSQSTLALAQAQQPLSAAMLIANPNPDQNLIPNTPTETPIIPVPALTRSTRFDGMPGCLSPRPAQLTDGQLNYRDFLKALHQRVAEGEYARIDEESSYSDDGSDEEAIFLMSPFSSPRAAQPTNQPEPLNLCSDSISPEYLASLVGAVGQGPNTASELAPQNHGITVEQNTGIGLFRDSPEWSVDDSDGESSDEVLYGSDGDLSP